VKISRARQSRNQGLLTTELVVALGILALCVLPLGFSFVAEQRLMRAAYQRAVAVQLVDGEAEILAAGTGAKFYVGEHSYAVTARATTNLPPGRFVFQRHRHRGELSWLPDRPLPGGPIRREFPLEPPPASPDQP